MADGSVLSSDAISEVQRDAIFSAIACGLCIAMGPAVLFLGTFALFLTPVSKDFAWGAAVYPGGLFLSGLVAALTGPFAGRLMDRYGVRTVLLPSFFVWTVSLAALSYIEGSTLRLYAICTVMGVAQAGCGLVAVAKVISGWFDRVRGLVLGLVLGAAPAGATVIALIVTRNVVVSQGWETTYRLTALVVFIVAFPIVALFLREAPAVDGAVQPGEPPRADGMRLMEALRTRAFWTFMLAAGIGCGIAMGINSHVMAWAVEGGMDLGLTTAALSAYSLAGPIGSLVSGIAADKVKSPKFLAGFFLLPFVSTLALLVGGESLLLPALFLLGLGFAAGIGLTPYFATRYYGIKYGSEILGVTLGALQLTIGLGPVLVGLAHDWLGSYAAGMPAVVVLALLPFALAVTLPRYEHSVSVAMPDRRDVKAPSS